MDHEDQGTIAPAHTTKTNVQENAAYEAKREARRTAARALRILLTARACRRITSALKERELAAARKADRA